MDELSGLLEAARSGHPGAFDELIARSSAEIGRFCRFLVGAADAEDAQQESYLAVWRALPQFRGECSARSWLFLITRRECQRLAERRGRWETNSETAGQPRPAPAPGEHLELMELLGRLDGERRSAFVLTQLAGFSYAEAALIDECPVGTIRSRVARARAELGEALLSEGRRSALGA